MLPDHDSTWSARCGCRKFESDNSRVRHTLISNPPLQRVCGPSDMLPSIGRLRFSIRRDAFYLEYRPPESNACPARTLRRGRCHVVTHAASAAHDDLRPCLRCRPELAPGFAPVDPNNRIRHSGSARIQAEALEEPGTVETLAFEHGVSARQLRRICGSP